jgi:hypothetical protein
MTDLPRDPRIPDLVSVTEAAVELDMTPQGVRKAAARGQLLGAKVGGTWVFRRAVIDRAKARRRPEPPANEH